MSNQVLIIGESGTGKSRSILNLNPAETVIINVIGKPLPFRGWKSKYKPFVDGGKSGNIIACDISSQILNSIKFISENRKEIKVIVIDDFQYVLCNEFMRRSDEKGYNKFTDIARHAWDLLSEGRSYRADLTIFYLSHSDRDEDGRTKCKTIGKLLDDKVCIEGLFTIVLKTAIIDGKYCFTTQNNGNDTVKSPEGMFPADKIENDLSLVVKHINAYEKGE